MGGTCVTKDVSQFIVHRCHGVRNRKIWSEAKYRSTLLKAARLGLLDFIASSASLIPLPHQIEVMPGYLSSSD